MQDARVVHNRMPLYGPWAGWRMAGRELVSPDGDRISPRRLLGILWAESSRKWILEAQRRPPPTPPVVLPPRESLNDSAWRANCTKAWNGARRLLAGVVDPMVPARQFGHRDMDSAATLEIIAGLFRALAWILAGTTRLAAA